MKLAEDVPLAKAAWNNSPRILQKLQLKNPGNKENLQIQVVQRSLGGRILKLA